MRRRSTIVAFMLGSIILIAWNGMTQFFPWGVPSVDNFSSTTSETYVASTQGLKEALPGTWTTGMFESDFSGRISTLATDSTFSWIISVPRDSYDLSEYLTRHAITQAATAALILIVLRVISPLPRRRRMGVIVIMSVLAAGAIYAGMMNWMGMPLMYGIGQSANYVMGWTISAAALDYVMFRPRKPEMTRRQA